MKTPTKHKQRGFSLIELMVTVALTAIVLVVGIPNFRLTIQENSYTSQANEFLGAISFARAEAVKRGDRVTMCKVKKTDAGKCDSSGNWGDGWLIFVDSSNAFNGTATTYTPGSSVLLKMHGPFSNSRLSEYISSSSTTSPVSQYLSFVANGSSQTATGAIQAGSFQLQPLTGSTVARCIKVNAAGRARILKGACT